MFLTGPARANACIEEMANSPAFVTANILPIISIQCFANTAKKLYNYLINRLLFNIPLYLHLHISIQEMALVTHFQNEKSIIILEELFQIKHQNKIYS
jgi:hypothetical protein